MRYNDFIVEFNKLSNTNLSLWKQTHIMFIPKLNKLIRETPIGYETRVKYDINDVWDKFVYLENKILFFIDKYLYTFIKGINVNKEIMNNCNTTISSNNILDESIYYFDSFITFFSTLIEPEQKHLLNNYLDSNIINNIFPNRNTIGLYWQIYMLRNRIVHFTSARYDNTTKECIRYYDFSSKIQFINIDNLNEIHVNYISNDIYFDYIDSGIKLIENIHNLLKILNKLFLDSFMPRDTESEKILNSKTSIVFYDKKIEYSVYDAFYDERSV